MESFALLELFVRSAGGFLVDAGGVAGRESLEMSGSEEVDCVEREEEEEEEEVDNLYEAEHKNAVIGSNLVRRVRTRLKQLQQIEL